MAAVHIPPSAREILCTVVSVTVVHSKSIAIELLAPSCELGWVVLSGATFSSIRGLIFGRRSCAQSAQTIELFNVSVDSKGGVVDEAGRGRDCGSKGETVAVVAR